MFLTPLARNETSETAVRYPGAADADSGFFPGAYSLAACVKKYGAAHYLAALRKRLEKGLYDKERFSLLAARAYAWNAQPRRCLSILVSCEEVSPQNKAAFSDLAGEAAQACREPETACSLNMIVRNEEENICGALDSVDDIMDEIVICDTGSTDDTKKKAEAYGATIISREWRGDFSAARNAALENSCGTWVLWLDADDRLSPQSKRQLADLIRTAAPHSAAFRVVNIQAGCQGAHFMQVRMFPRIPGARFERRVHEQISSCMTRLKIPYGEHRSIVIFHEGYDKPAANRKKALRNKPLIISEIEETRDTPVLLLSLADCHMILGETKEALAAYERVISHPLAAELYRDVFVQAHFNIGLLYRSLEKNAIAKIWFEKTMKLDNSRTEALYLLGLIAEAEGNGDLAFSFFLECSQKKPPVRQTATDSHKIRIDSVFRIGKYLFDNGLLEQCECVIARAAEKYPHVVDFHTLLGKVFLCKNKIAEATRHFMTSLSLAPKNNPEPYRGMATIYLMFNDKSTARKFLVMAEDSEKAQDKKCSDRDISLPALPLPNHVYSLAVA